MGWSRVGWAVVAIAGCASPSRGPGGGGESSSGGAAETSAIDADVEPGPTDLPSCWNGSGLQFRFDALAVDAEGNAHLAVMGEDSWCGPGTGYHCRPDLHSYGPDGAEVGGDFGLYDYDPALCRTTLAFSGTIGVMGRGFFFERTDGAGTVSNGGRWLPFATMDPRGIAVAGDGTIYAFVQPLHPLDAGPLVAWLPPVESARATEPAIAVPQRVRALVATDDGFILGGEGVGPIARYDAGGQVIWASDLPSQGHGVSAIAMGASGALYVGSFDPVDLDAPADAPTMVRYDGLGGLDPTFVREPEVSGEATPVWAIAVSEADELVCTLQLIESDNGGRSNAGIRCHDLDGGLRWEDAEHDAVSSYPPDIPSSLRIAPGGRIVAAVRDGGLAVASWSADGDLLWQSSAD